MLNVSLGVSEQRRPRDVPLVRCKEQDVRAGRVHLVRLPGVDGFLLHSLNLQSIQFLIKHLTDETKKCNTAS